MKNLNEKNLRKGVVFLWKRLLVFGNFAGTLYGLEYIKDKIWKPKRRIFDYYDENIINETSELWKESIRQVDELDVIETLNKLQEIEKYRKKND